MQRDDTAERFLRQTLVAPVGQPLRVAVYSRLASGIRSGVLPVGSLLPRETDLAEMLGISRTPVREALILLEEDGLVSTRRGLGRLIASSTLATGLERFQPIERLLQRPDAETTTRPLGVELQQAGDFVSLNLDLDAAANTWFKESVVSIGGTPAAIAQEHLPAGRYLEEISGRLHELVTVHGEGPETLLQRITEELGPVLDPVSSQVAANVAGDHRAALLNIEETDPVLIMSHSAAYKGRTVYLAKWVISSHIGALPVHQTGSR